MRSWKIDLGSGVFTVEAPTEEAAREEVIRQIKTALSEITVAEVRLVKNWIVDLGSFSVEAADEKEAYEEARKQIKGGGVEIDTIYQDEETED